MKKVIYTLFINFRYFFLHYFCPALLITLIIIGLYCLIKHRKDGTKIFDIFKNKRLVCSLSYVFYLLFLLQSTVFDRLLTGQRQDPLENVFGGWIIVETQYFYDLSVMWNLLMLCPVFLFALFYCKIRGRDISYLKLTVISALLAFFNSALIETLQLIFCVGTFQISDLVYNTLGGIIGGLAYIFIKNIIKKKQR